MVGQFNLVSTYPTASNAKMPQICPEDQHFQISGWGVQHLFLMKSSVVAARFADVYAGMEYYNEMLPHTLHTRILNPCTGGPST